MRIKLILIALFSALVLGCTSSTEEKPRTSTFSHPAPAALTAGRVTETEIDFTWDPVPEAPRYRVWVSTNADMSNGKFQRTTGSSTIETFTGLTNNTDYYARVRVITEDGQNLSPYSEQIVTRTYTTVQPSPAPSDPAPPSAEDNAVTKVLSIWLENKSYRQAERGMPYLVGLSKKYGYFKAWKATTHPSNPNYIDAGFGSNFGVAVNRDAGSGHYNKPTVFGQAIKNGKTAKEYLQKAPGNCPTRSASPFESRHEIWAHSKLPEERALCKKFAVPMKDNFIADVRSGNLPNVGLLVPDDCNNAHDCSIATADRFIKARWEAIIQGPDWKSGRLLVNVVFDEDDKRSGNIVWSAALHPGLNGKVVSAPMNHNSLTRLWNQVGNTPYMEGAKTAPDMADALGLVVK